MGSGVEDGCVVEDEGEEQSLGDARRVRRGVALWVLGKLDLTGAQPFVNRVMSGEKSADQLLRMLGLLNDADTVLRVLVEWTADAERAVLFAAIDALRSLKLPGLEPKVEQAEAGARSEHAVIEFEFHACARERRSRVPLGGTFVSFVPSSDFTRRAWGGTTRSGSGVRGCGWSIWGCLLELHDLKFRHGIHPGVPYGACCAKTVRKLNSCNPNRTPEK